MSDRAIVLFDGVCNGCVAFVRLILKRDRHAFFRFASLQSEEGRALARRHDVDLDEIDSVILVHRGKAFVRSDAALRIVRRLSALWPALALLTVLPRPLRDRLYRVVAARRYAWFGKRDRCYVPEQDVRDRFLG